MTDKTSFWQGVAQAARETPGMYLETVPAFARLLVKLTKPRRMRAKPPGPKPEKSPEVIVYRAPSIWRRRDGSAATSRSLRGNRTRSAKS